ncbi:ATP-dependent DNA ligase [Streptomyces sp. F63]|uniref:ATP-dependent DNA ligase n=1 Tax=Streptomyces sp. F63 TaxID=2824887 RepID=UPI001B359D63|nr:RNA ligase family protein [Streptomyces sp. F63]MBQ0984967.1 ATP-dependent DNA ligase [Streptomyces sp. F63]
MEVALARPVERLPRGAGLAYEPKFDGHRVVLLRDPDRVLLQARSGRIVTDSFPDLVAAAEALPAGTVLDGEVVVWTAGRTDFAAVQKRALAGRGRAAELARRLPASYAAFDLLATGADDLRPLPYRRRRAALTDLLAAVGPPVQAVPMTTDPELAALWYETLTANGVEGLVVKRLDGPYRGGRRDWLKLRHSDTRDAVVAGVTGSRTHPRALAVILPGDDTPVLTSPLAPAVRAQLAGALAGLPPGAAPPAGGAVTTDGTPYLPVPPVLTVEVRQSSTRHPLTTVSRLRLPE